VNQENSTTPPTGIVVVPGTDLWTVEGDSHLGKWAIEKGDIVTDPFLFRFLDPYLKDVHTIWSLGANIGDHVLHYLRQRKYVVAIEPHPVTFECLRHNCPDALCLNIAASDREGTVNLMGCENVGASRIRADGEWTVPCQALDDHPDLPAPGFIEVDIEGHEHHAIIGMAGTITRHKPVIFCEMNRGALEEQGFTVEGLDDLIRSLGYREAVLYPRTAMWDWSQFDCLFLPL
jgi:FkbM family methyltransferase